MELRQPKNIEKQDEFYSAFYKALEEHISGAKTKVEESKTLFSIGVYDDVFKLIEKAHKDPLSIISEKVELEVKVIHSILNGMVNAFFANHKDSIKYSANAKHENNALYYYIVLKDNNIETKSPFSRFIFDYDRNPLSKKFPIIFDFVSENIFKELEKEYQPA